MVSSCVCALRGLGIYQQPVECRLLLAWRHDSLLVLQASMAFCMKRCPCLCLAGHTRGFDESTPEASLCGSKCLGHRERFCHVSCHNLQMLLWYNVMSRLTFESQLHLSQWDNVNHNSTGNYIGCFVQCSLFHVTATSSTVTVWLLTSAFV